jgi:hypothetical protein
MNSNRKSNVQLLNDRNKYVSDSERVKHSALKFAASTYNYSLAASNARSFSKPNAHGFFAESLVEVQAIFQGKSAELMHSMGRKWKDRGDVMIDGEEVQVKVHATSASTVSALTDGHGGQRYLNDDGSKMQIKVADDQVEYCNEHGINATGIGHNYDDLKDFYFSSAGFEWLLKDSYLNAVTSPNVLFRSLADAVNEDYIDGYVSKFENFFLSQERVRELSSGSSRKTYEVIFKVCINLFSALIRNATSSFIFGAMMNGITLISSWLALHIFGFTTGGVILIGIVGIFVLGKFIYSIKNDGIIKACKELFKTVFYISISVIISPIVSGLIYSVVLCKEKLVKYTIDFWNYFLSFFKIS